MGGSAGTTTINATTTWIAFVFPWPGGDLTRAAFQCTAASGSPTATVQLFNTDATDGGSTPVNTGSAIGSAVNTSTMSANTIVQVTGIGQSSLAAGVYALRITLNTGTSFGVLRGYNAGGLIGASHQFPFCVTFASSTQTKVQSQSHALALGGSVYVPVIGLAPPCAITAQTAFSSSTNPDENGLWVTNPNPFGVRLCGLEFYNNSNTRPDLQLNYYTGSLASPTLVFSQTFDRDLTGSVAAAGPNVFQISESNKPWIASGATVGLGLRALTNHNCTIHCWDFLTGNQSVMDCWWGQAATFFTRNAGSGALTQTSFKTPVVNLLYDGVDIPSGGGSGGGNLVNSRLLVRTMGA